MPCKCSVPACRGNYDEEHKVAVFGFPADEALRNRWLHAIRRKDFIITKNSKVCERHFKEGEIERITTFYNEKTGETLKAPLKKPRLKENVVPSIFPGCPSYMTASTSATRESPLKKRQRLEHEQMLLAVSESLNSKVEYDKKTTFTNYEELKNCLKYHNFSSFWTLVEKMEGYLFLNLAFKDDNIPFIKYAVSISKELMLSVSFMGERISKKKKVTIPFRVHNVNEIFDTLDYFQNCTNDKSISYVNEKLHVIESVLENTEGIFTDKNKCLIEFFLEQLQLLKCKPERYRYSPNILIFASILFYISPQAYKFLRNSNYMILPDPSTIRKIGSILKNSPQTEEYTNFLVYAKHAFHNLKNDDLEVFLMIDEIHIKPFLDYKGGNIVGMAYNSSNLATSVQVFMLQSLFSQYKDVIHIVPTDNFDAAKLFDLMRKVVVGLEEIGFRVMGIITDNNSINRRAASFFSDPPKLQIKYEHPVDGSRPLFYVIDSVHILKCVRNNWLNNHKNGYFFYYPDFDSLNNVCSASLSSVRKLYDLESSHLLKFGYGLTRKALWPTNIERQNVKLALKLFSTDVAHALNELGEKFDLECYDQTAKFISIICTWWDVVNVKTPNKGKFKCNPMCEPLTNSPNDKKLIFLKQLVSWVKKWENLDSNNGRLSKETFLSLSHTSQAFIEIMDYCSTSLKKEYILLGKIQTDKLESRFGQYRSLAGDQYHISVRQIYETESKLRLCHELKLASHEKSSIDVNIFDDSEKIEKKQPIDLIFCDIGVDESDIENIKDKLSIITYLGGYCCHAAFKKTKCSHCRERLTTDKKSFSHDNYKLIHVKDRGRLLYPTEIVVNAVIHTYLVVQKLISEKYENKFIKVLNQRTLVINLVEDILVTKDAFLSFDVCMDGHDILHLINIIIRSATNSLLNNYCKVKNDNLKKITNLNANSKKKRKLETFSKSESKKLEGIKINEITQEVNEGS